MAQLHVGRYLGCHSKFVSAEKQSETGKNPLLSQAITIHTLHIKRFVVLYILYMSNWRLVPYRKNSSVTARSLVNILPRLALNDRYELPHHQKWRLLENTLAFEYSEY